MFQLIAIARCQTVSAQRKTHYLLVFSLAANFNENDLTLTQ